MVGLQEICPCPFESIGIKNIEILVRKRQAFDQEIIPLGKRRSVLDSK